MKPSATCRQRGFTLLETVIAIGVLAVLLTGFMVVFAPAADGIRKSINVQQADRMASALEQELVTLRKGEQSGDIATGFDKAFYRVKDSTGPNQSGQDSGNPDNALLVYQYRAKISSFRDDGTPQPEATLGDKVAGKDYIIVPMMRRRNDPLFRDPKTGDVAAVEGGVYLVKCVQLVFENAALQPIDQTDKSLRGKIKNPKPNSTPPDPNYKSGPFTVPTEFPEAVVAFTVDFYMVPTKAPSYFGSGGKFDSFYTKAKTPFFTRNLAVRR
jgi:prepilin-type N-terminal cleavage/methylation domain-containing protein